MTEEGTTPPDDAPATAQDPATSFARVSLAFAYLAQGRLEEALEHSERESVPYMRLTALAIVQQALGDRPQASAAQQALLAEYGDLAAYQQATIFAQWGELERAVEWLERAYRQRDPGLAWVKMDPQLVPLHGLPRYEALLARMNLAS